MATNFPSDVAAAFLLIAVMAIRFAAGTLLASVTLALAELCDHGGE
jgi:hypothetical protein